MCPEIDRRWKIVKRRGRSRETTVIHRVILRSENGYRTRRILYVVVVVVVIKAAVIVSRFSSESTPTKTYILDIYVARNFLFFFILINNTIYW